MNNNKNSTTIQFNPIQHFLIIFETKDHLTDNVISWNNGKIYSIQMKLLLT